MSFVDAPHIVAPSGTRARSMRTRSVVAVVCAVVLIPLVFSALLPWWTAMEASLSGRLAASIGSAQVTPSGSELLVRGDAGTLVLSIVNWCSSLGPVLAVVASAVTVPGPRSARARSAVAAVSLLAVGNVVRLAALVWWGANVNPAGVDRLHDGPATALAVVLVLASTALVVLVPTLSKDERAPRSGP